MTQIRATLIQGIAEFKEYLRKPLQQCMEAFPDTDGEEDVIKWIICEELEETHHLFDTAHIHNRIPHIHIRDMLRGILTIPLSEIVNWYIKAPQLYVDDRQIKVILRGRDLYINYYTNFRHIPSTHPRR